MSLKKITCIVVNSIIRIDKSMHRGIVVTTLQVVEPRLGIIDIPAVPQRVLRTYRVPAEGGTVSVRH